MAICTSLRKEKLEVHDKLSDQDFLQEQARLKAFDDYFILDTLPEQSYEDLTALAAAICETPISLLSLVAADRQWFKSERGLGLRETPLSVSFCKDTVHSGELLMVEDAQQDERYQANPLVAGDPGIRFYAGAPIRDEAGQVLGTVCVLDTVPRHLTPKQIGALEALARQAMCLLESRRARTYLERTVEVALEMAEKLAAGQGRPILSAAGELLKTLGADFDITHSVNALQQLRVSEARAERILESIGDAVIVTDENTLVSRMNRVAESLTGWPLHEAKGQPLTKVFNIVNEATRDVVESPADKVKRLGTVVGLANHTVLIAKMERKGTSTTAVLPFGMNMAD